MGKVVGPPQPRRARGHEGCGEGRDKSGLRETGPFILIVKGVVKMCVCGSVQACEGARSGETGRGKTTRRP
jgi:hypothetical protein